ncbi:MAG: nuclear transport factor 2 family protein [Devosia sp.]
MSITKSAFAGSVAAALVMTSAQADELKEIAVGILTQGLVQGDKTFIERYVAQDYIQHNPQAPDGRAGLLGFVDYLQLQAGFTVEPVRVLRDGHLVAVHSLYRGEGTQAVFDIFRFENGVAVEHWDVIQTVPETTVSGRTMTDGPVEITDREATEANRRLVMDFYRDVLIEGRVEKAADYLGETYHQHNSQIADGLEGLMAFFQYLQENQIPLSLERTHRSIAEGNVVLLHSEGQIGGTLHAFADLFRVENGKIVEHWDTVQEVPEIMAHDNGMF